MKRLFASYFYKLRHDLAFKITVIVGFGVALFMAILYYGLGKLAETPMVSGVDMFIISLSPVQNFGIAIPINLITFTTLEFSQGSIRNKIISGHSKGKIYLSLFVDGLILTFLLLGAYSLLSFAFGCMFGGFNIPISESSIPVPGMPSSLRAPDYVWKLVILTILCFTSIISMTVLFSTLFRNIGPTIPVIIIPLVILYVFGTVIVLVANENETAIWLARIFDPLYGLSAMEFKSMKVTMVIEGETVVKDVLGKTINTETFVSGIISNLVYSAIFFTIGFFVFKKRDVK